MTSAKLASIIAPLRSALDYGVAASMNGDPRERADLERKMINRIQHVLENSEFEIIREQKRLTA